MDGLRDMLALHIYNNYELSDDEGNNYLDFQTADTLAYEFMMEFFINGFDNWEEMY